MKPAILFLFVFLNIFFAASAQTGVKSEQDYNEVILGRSKKIVNTLGIRDSSLYNRATLVIANQYHALNDIQEKRDSNIKELKSNIANDKASLDTRIKETRDRTDSEIAKL